MPDLEDDKPAARTAVERQRFVEQALGFRVVRFLDAPHEFSSGVQVQRLGPNGRVVSVFPSDGWAFRMFQLLCTPESEWGEE